MNTIYKISPAAWALLHHFYAHTELEIYPVRSVPDTRFSIKFQVVKSLEARGFIRPLPNAPFVYRITILGRQTLLNNGLNDIDKMQAYLRKKKARFDLNGDPLWVHHA